jgi:lipoprotein-anchoring transpeptidase ErfK/SrfK
MDVWMGPADKPEEWVYVRSFNVGLGAAESETPVGTFIVKKGSKLVDPPWTHPKTGEHFNGGDPKNPLGHFWVGLEGTGESTSFAGYGIHGTIEPESIGQRRSMGCVRLVDADIALVYELMGESLSTVKIVP